MSEPNPIDSGVPAGRTPRLRTLAAFALLLLAVAGVSAALFSGAGGAGVARTPAVARSGYLGTLALPARQAPPLQLRNYQGRPVSIAAYRGRVVLVTFLYTRCPDVCPLIAANLRAALALLGPRAARAQLIAVSVDPRGDTPAAVARFLRVHDLRGRMEYLIGSAAELARTWSAWSVGAKRQAASPELVAHSALVYGVSASGRLITLYPSSFEPHEIAHDIPLLAAR